MDDHPRRRRATTTLPEMRRAGIAVCQATLLARAKPEVRRPEGHSPAEPRLRQPGDRLGHGARAARLLRAARAPGAAADDPHGRRARRPLGAVAGRRPVASRSATSWRWRGPTRSSSPSQAVEWWNLGLRSVNLAHYGRSRYAVGTGDDGPLTRGGGPAPQGVRAARHDPRRDPPLRHQLLPGARRLRRPGARQPQQLPGPGPGRPAVLRRADPPADRARRRDRRGPRRLDARTGLGQRPDLARGRRPRGRRRSHRPRLPARRQQPPRRDRQRPRRRLRHRADPRRAWTRISDLQKLDEILDAPRLLPSRRSTTSSTATGSGSSAPTSPPEILPSPAGRGCPEGG